MIEIIYFILSPILIVVLFCTVISLKNNNKFSTKISERRENMVVELEQKLKKIEEALAIEENKNLELSIQLRINKELLLDQKNENENLLKLIEEMQKAKSVKEEDVIIEYFLKTKK